MDTVTLNAATYRSLQDCLNAAEDEVGRIRDGLRDAEKAGDALQVLAAYRAVRRAALAQ